jgi:hypothetical protein
LIQVGKLRSSNLFKSRSSTPPFNGDGIQSRTPFSVAQRSCIKYDLSVAASLTIMSSAFRWVLCGASWFGLTVLALLWDIVMPRGG